MIFESKYRRIAMQRWEEARKEALGEFEESVSKEVKQHQARCMQQWHSQQQYVQKMMYRFRSQPQKYQ